MKIDFEDFEIFQKESGFDKKQSQALARLLKNTTLEFLHRFSAEQSNLKNELKAEICDGPDKNFVIEKIEELRQKIKGRIEISETQIRALENNLQYLSTNCEGYKNQVEILESRIKDLENKGA